MSHERFEALSQNAANYVPLSPLSFLKRTAQVFGARPAVIYGERRYTWAQVHQRSAQLASALQKVGIGLGDTVSVIAPNTPEVIEAHFGVPMVGAVLNTINFRLEADTIAYILKHSDCKLLIADAELLPKCQQALKTAGLKLPIVRIDDDQASLKTEATCNGAATSYEDFIASGNANFDWQLPADEWQALALNYTSGTSGKPKGAVYHHRGSYLMSMGTAAAWQLPMHPVYLYTVPLFHCNGWGHAWTVCMMAGTLICCRAVSAAFIFKAIAEHHISHFGGAPIVLGMIVNAPEHERLPLPHRVRVMTAGAPPPPAILKQINQLGFEVMQVYGLTETFGHITHCLWQQQWDELPEDERAQIQSWQGIPLPITEDIALLEPNSGAILEPSDEQAGEIAIRGNTVMKGYYKDPKASAQAFKDGWFRSGDVAVWRSGSYLQIKDRLKDVIISGGENISSVEVEAVLYSHPAVAHAAVVARKDEKWGEVPHAFVECKPNTQVQSDELIAFCRQRLAGFKTPKSVSFCTLPKTATGKIQKYLLRQQLPEQ